MAIWAINRTHLLLRVDFSTLKEKREILAKHHNLLEQSYDGELLAIRTDPITYKDFTAFWEQRGLLGWDRQENADFTLVSGGEVLVSNKPKWLEIKNVNFRLGYQPGFAWIMQGTKQDKLIGHPQRQLFLNGRTCFW